MNLKNHNTNTKEPTFDPCKYWGCALGCLSLWNSWENGNTVRTNLNKKDKKKKEKKFNGSSLKFRTFTLPISYIFSQLTNLIINRKILRNQIPWDINTPKYNTSIQSSSKEWEPRCPFTMYMQSPNSGRWSGLLAPGPFHAQCSPLTSDNDQALRSCWASGHTSDLMNRSGKADTVSHVQLLKSLVLRI